MIGRDLCRSVAAKRHPMSVSELEDAELWAIVLGDRRAGRVIAAHLSDMSLEDWTDEHQLARELRTLPHIAEGRAGQVLAALVAVSRARRKLAKS